MVAQPNTKQALGDPTTYRSQRHLSHQDMQGPRRASGKVICNKKSRNQIPIIALREKVMNILRVASRFFSVSSRHVQRPNANDVFMRTNPDR